MFLFNHQFDLFLHKFIKQFQIQKKDEKVFITIVALIATNVCAYSFSQISEIVKYEQDKKQTYLSMMAGINKEMNDIGLNILLQHKVRKYYEFQHNQGSEDRSNKLSLIEILPAQIKEEVLLDVNVNFINQISFINSLSKECRKEISLSIKQKIFYPDEVVFKEKESNSCLYFISQGSINLTITIKTKSQVSNETQSEMSIEHLKVSKLLTYFVQLKKDVFGFEGFIENQQNPYSAKANEYTVLSYIDREELMTLLSNFPFDYERFCYIKDEVVFTNKYRLVNRKCLSCGELIHSFRDCPKINPIIKQKDIKKVKEAINEREKTIRKRVCLYKPLRDQAEIAKQAISVMAKNDEESILSDLCSVLVDEEGVEIDDNEDSSQSLEEDDADEDFDERVEERPSGKKKKRTSIYLQEQDSSDILNEDEEVEFNQERDKRKQRRSRTHKLVSFTDIENLQQQINQEQNNQKMITSNSNNINNQQSKSNQASRFSKYKNTTESNLNNIYAQDKIKFQNCQLDIIDENEEESTCNMMSSLSIWNPKMKRRQETLMVPENNNEIQNKLNTINELNENQDLDSPGDCSFSFDSHTLSFKGQKSEHANHVNVFGSPLNSPIHTIERIKLESNKQSSFKMGAQKAGISLQSQNSNNFVSQNTLKALEMELNANNNQNSNNYQNDILKSPSKYQDISQSYNQSTKITLMNPKTAELQDTEFMENDDPVNNQDQNGFFDSVDFNNNQFQKNQDLDFSSNLNQPFENNEKLNHNQKVNNIQKINSNLKLNLNLRHTNSKKLSGSIKLLNNNSMYNDNQNINNEESQIFQNSNFNSENVVNSNESQLLTNELNIERNQSRNYKTLNSNSINMSIQEDYLNTQEDNDDEFLFAKNRINFKDYDIFEKIQIRRRKKGLKTFIQQERAMAQKLTQKIAEQNTAEDILNHLARTASRKQTIQRTILIQQRQQAQISPQEFLNQQNILQTQLQHEKKTITPVQALSLARKTSRKQTRVLMNSHMEQSQADGNKFQRRLGTIRATNIGSQKDIEVQSPRRNNTRVATRIHNTKQTMVTSINKHLERKPTHGTATNSSILGSNQVVNPLNTSNIIEQHNAVQGINVEANHESSEYMIRCQYNLQMLDLLIVRKHYLMQQQKGLIFNFIFVEDNEIDIDVGKEFKQYYPNQNKKEILKSFRKIQSKYIKSTYPQLKLPKNNSKTKKNKDSTRPKVATQGSKSSFAPTLVQQSIVSINS